MDNVITKISWMDMPKVYPALNEISDAEKADASRWLFWQVCQTNPDAGRALLAQLDLVLGFQEDHQSWRSYA